MVTVLADVKLSHFKLMVQVQPIVEIHTLPIVDLEGYRDPRVLESVVKMRTLGLCNHHNRSRNKIKKAALGKAAFETF